MNSFFRWIFPLIYGIATFSGIRLVTDIPKQQSFWQDNYHSPHLYGMILSIVCCYLFDIACRIYMKKKQQLQRSSLSTLRECLVIGICFLPILNLTLYIASFLNVIYMGNGLGDYVIANVVVIPMFLIYYIIIRSDNVYKYQSEQTLQLEKLKSDHLDSELKLLKSQYHPHFLFNALNTVYFQVDEENDAAKNTIELLSDLLRYQLYDIDRMVTIEQEIDYMKTYIRFQKLRMNERLILNEYFDFTLNDKQIHPLLFQPLLENAFKYVGGEYWINIYFTTKGNKIVFTVENAISMEKLINKKSGGIGIENLRRRLVLLYPGKHSLEAGQDVNMFLAILTIEL